MLHIYRPKSLRFAAAAHTARLAVRKMKRNSSDVGASDSSIVWCNRQATKRRQVELWRTPLDLIHAIAGMHRGSRASRTPRRSSIRSRSTKTWKRLKRRHVRFQGVPSALTTKFTAVLVRCARPGSSVATAWSLMMTCVNVADSILLPVSLVAHEFIHSKKQWLDLYDRSDVEHAISKHQLWAGTELWLDLVFLADLLFRVSQAAVLDMGLADSSADRIVSASSMESNASSPKPVQSNAESYGKGFVFGPALRNQLVIGIPLRLLLMVPLWLSSIHPMGATFVSIATLARAYRILDVMAYFSARQEDVATDVRWIAFFKFAYIIYLTVRSVSLKLVVA